MIDLFDGYVLDDEILKDFLLFGCPLFFFLFVFFLLHLLHEKGEIGIFLEISAEYFLVFTHKLFIVLFGYELPFLFHKGHVFHIELRVVLDFLNHSD